MVRTRRLLSADAGCRGGLDLSSQQVLSFRIMQRHDDARNTGGDLDLSIRLPTLRRDGIRGALSGHSGAPRPNPAVGAGTSAKSVYETYRIPSLPLQRGTGLSWRTPSRSTGFDRTATGAVTIDDVVFAHAGSATEVARASSPIGRNVRSPRFHGTASPG